MVFENYGFKTEKVLLPGLDIFVELNQNQYFRNDGAVKDMDEHGNKAITEFGAPSHLYQRDEIYYGRHIGLSVGSIKASLIFVKKDSFRQEIFCYGHEATHALIYLGLEDYFIDMLKKEGFKLNPFKKYNDEESIAHIGGIISLYKINKHKGLDCITEISPLLEELMKSKTQS